MEDRGRFALKKLLNVAHTGSGRGRRVTDFLRAGRKTELHAGFGLIDLANPDPHIGEDMVTIFTVHAGEEDVVYPRDHRSEIGRNVAQWRPQAETA